MERRDAGQDTVIAAWTRRISDSGDRPVIHLADGHSLTAAQLDDWSLRLAARLKASGARPGDRVTVRVEKSSAVVALLLACLRSRLVYQPLNTAYAPAELDYFVDDADPAVIVCDPRDEVGMAERAARFASGDVAILTLDGAGEGTLTQDAQSVGDVAPPPMPTEDEPAAILYTSGTTGKPKGAVLTHRNLGSNAQTLIDTWGFTADDVLIHGLPIYHTHGLFVAILCPLLSGARMIFLPRFDPEQVTKVLPTATAFMGVPTHYTRLLGQSALTREQCAGMRLFVSGSAPLREETFTAFEERTGHRILERYGMTEINMACSNPLYGERRPGTVGFPLPGISVRVTDPADEEGNPVLPPGTPGMLQVRGPNVFNAYWRKPEKTAAAFTADGYFRTGDLALVDGDGYITIVGRDSDLIISGGLNVYPKEVEQVLDALDGIEESAVFGVPHPDFGEAVVAVAVPANDDPALLPTIDAVHLALDAEIARYKQPKHIEPIDEIPRNSMGKVQKAQLRERYRDLFSK